MNPILRAFTLSGGADIVRGIITRMAGSDGFVFSPGTSELTPDQLGTLKARMVAKGYEREVRIGPDFRTYANQVAQGMEYATLYNRVDNPRLTIDPAVPFPGQAADSTTRTYQVLVIHNRGDGTRSEQLVDVTAGRALSKAELFNVAVVRAEDLMRRGQDTVIGAAKGDDRWDVRVLSAFRGEVTRA